VFWTPDGESFMLQTEYFRKTLWKMSSRHFRLFWDDFVWGLYGGGFNANLLSAIPVSGRLFTRHSSILNFHERLITYYALIGQLASRRVRRI
jgi:hypothetical protein